ncbi:multidrug ABC transporter ATP-binding protein [Halostagnicola larsenii XH-48]|uniref:Multidrug ABC transporter ATP-binding protein n=1 Tax=Halostagnicola larsenii XH-48 TaxID=797299 RepID=W0JM07_9EURY|nr:ABC transporter ATP-binding protein [Halostagnicola larsenii]AHF99633.1 multidrug ABC transporter ATP-binding protein [Halostagnicola larsenii XH-48]
MSVDTPAIEARNLRKEFGDDGILNGIDLAVQENEVLLLMGPNGTGKTVLLSCLAGSLNPTAGDVRVFGDPVREDGGHSLSLLLQGGASVDSLSGRETAAFYARLHPAFTDRWRDLVDDLGLADDLDKRIKHYSEGMKRKLELALALAIDTPLYLLDEPTAGVDLSMVQRFHRAIRDRVRDGGTVVTTSHRPVDADLATRIAFVNDGSITAVGTPTELLDGVPPVVRIVGAGSDTETLESLVADGTLFYHGDERRGFLADGITSASLETATGTGVTAEIVEPSYTDAFNYYVHTTRTNE